MSRDKGCRVDHPETTESDDGKARRHHGLWFAAIVPIVLLGLMWFGYREWSTPDGESVFEDVFGMKVPSGVDEIVAVRRYVGGPGDTATYVRFRATPSALAALLANRDMEVDEQFVEFHFESGGDLCGLWDVAFGGYIQGVPAWMCPASFPKPDYYKWIITENGLRTVSILWSAETLEAYALILDD